MSAKIKNFRGDRGGWNSPAANVAAPNGIITPSNSTIYETPIRYIRVGTAGDLVLVLHGDDEGDPTNFVTIAVKDGEELTSFAIRQVRATDTTAGGLLGFY